VPKVNASAAFFGGEQRERRNPFFIHLKMFKPKMKTNQTALTELISRLEVIHTEFYRNAEMPNDTDQSTFENAVNEAQTVIGSVIADSIVAQARDSAAQ
jgi:hypothetical protein